MTMWPGFESNQQQNNTQESDNNTPEKATVSAHERSDLDSSPVAQHHTLGISPNQASPGDHSHNGRDSKSLNIDAAVMNAIMNNATTIADIIGFEIMRNVTFTGSRNTDSWRQQVMAAMRDYLGAHDSTTT